MPQLTVKEASETYERAMRNVLPVGPGVCPICHTFIDADAGWDTCYACSRHPNELDLMVPITYSENLGQMHLALRNYKDGYGAGTLAYAQARIGAILWRFLDDHEACVAAAAGVHQFELVTTVPSSSAARDDVGIFRKIVGWCVPVRDRLERVLAPTGHAPAGRLYHPERYHANRDLTGSNVLLLDDTWTTGGHAQSAAHVLRDAGAKHVAMVVVGRHVTPTWAVGSTTCAEILKGLPRFDWTRCCAHALAPLER